MERSQTQELERSQTQELEQEVTFEAAIGLPLPDLRDIVGRTERLPQQHLETAYFDTADGRLWDRGITLRHRTTDAVGSGVWTLKLPSVDNRSSLGRIEVSCPGERYQIPRDTRAIVRGLVRRAPLDQLVELDTIRQRLALHVDDRVVAEIEDDTVVVIGGPRDGHRFRQVELELYRGAKSITPKVTSRLEEAGVSVGGPPKLALAAGLGRSSAAKQQLNRTSSLAQVIRAALAGGFDRLVEHDWRLRLAVSEPRPHDVHQARVASRRLRSDLKTFQTVLDPVWVRHVRSDLKWLGSALGELRDIDVLASDLRDAPAELSEKLVRQRGKWGQHLVTLLASDRYLDLLDRLHAATRTPPFLSGEAIRSDDAAIEVLPSLVGDRWRVLRRQVRKGGSHPSDHQLHRIRIKAKQLRYAAEAAAPVVGSAARRTASTAEEVQTILGKHRDAVAAEAWLREQVGASNASTVSVSAVFDAGRLSAERRRRQRKLRNRWSSSWKALTNSKQRSWLK